jgi:hypothetical protein
MGMYMHCMGYREKLGSGGYLWRLELLIFKMFLEKL